MQSVIPEKSIQQQETATLIDRAAISSIRKVLSNNPRDLLLFEMALRTRLRMKELLHLKVESVMHLKVGDPLPERSARQGREAAPLTDAYLVGLIRRHLEKILPQSPGAYLFPSRKGSGPLGLASASHLFKSWFRVAGVSGSFRAGSLRGSWDSPGKRPEAFRDLKDSRGGPTDGLQPIEGSTIQERVYQELYRAIISGRIPPGEKLVTVNVAERMEVSPMPVREALHRLEAAGFISAQKKRGMVVNELSRRNLSEITKIRLKLEPMAAKKAALRRSEPSVTHLAGLHQEFVQAKRRREVDRFLFLNREFHNTIYREANMPILLPIIDGLWARVSPYLHILMREGRYEVSDYTIETHRGMLEGMQAKDPAKLVLCLKKDLAMAAKALLTMFEHLGSQNARV